MVSYLKFWFKSSNQHGVHSPFLYQLITGGLYSKESRWQGRAKTDVFVERVLAYFKPQRGYCFSANEAVVDLLSREGLQLQKDANFKADVIFIDASGVTQLPTVEKIVEHLHKDGFVVIDRRLKSPALEALWQSLVAHNSTSLTVDFYFFGLIFVRTEQLKQHFYIRL